MSAAEPQMSEAPEGPTPAQRRATRRANQTTFNLMLALAASLLIVLFLVVVVVRPERDPITVDYRAVAQQSQSSFDEPLVVPALPDSWGANRAEVALDPADGVATWEVGFLTPGGDYIELTQGVDANGSWLADQVREARSSSTLTIGGIRWDVYDRRDVDDPGNVAYALVAVSGASTVVLSGTADDAEFEELATSVAEELGR